MRLSQMWQAVKDFWWWNEYSLTKFVFRSGEKHPFPMRFEGETPVIDWHDEWTIEKVKKSKGDAGL